MVAGEVLTLVNEVDGERPDVVSGFPLLWAEPGPGLMFTRLSDAGRRMIEVSPGKPSEKVTVKLSSPELERFKANPPLQAKADPTSVVWRALYRGGATAPGARP